MDLNWPIFSERAAVVMACEKVLGPFWLAINKRASEAPSLSIVHLQVLGLSLPAAFLEQLPPLHAALSLGMLPCDRKAELVPALLRATWVPEVCNWALQSSLWCGSDHLLHYLCEGASFTPSRFPRPTPKGGRDSAPLLYYHSLACRTQPGGQLEMGYF